jgi:hypothetical protein
MSLNDQMSFDHVVRVYPDGFVIDAEGMYAPEFEIEVNDDGQIVVHGEREMRKHLREQGWDVLTGFTNQYAYNGCIMHDSEYIGGGLEKYIRETPGYYVACVVRCSDGEYAGWLVAYREAE